VPLNIYESIAYPWGHDKANIWDIRLQSPFRFATLSDQRIPAELHPTRIEKTV